MKILIQSIVFVMVIAQGFWAYTENYETQKALTEAKNLRRDIASARARIGVLNAEWAYLNRPDRLQDLVDMNFDRLQLLPLRPEQFGLVAEVPLTTQIVSDIEEAVALSALEVSE